MKIVVTGATSFLGAAFVRHLLRLNYDVYAVIRPGSVHRKSLPEREENLRVLEMELEKMDELSAVIGERCDYFVHFGWDGSGSKNRMLKNVQQKNVRDSLKALEGAKNLGCRRFLFAGSQAEYGQCQKAMKEGQVCRPVSEYGRAKLNFYCSAREACRQWQNTKESSMEYIHARIFSVYGTGDHPWSLVSSCLDTFLAGEHIDLGVCTQMWNYLYLDDFAEGMAQLLLHKGRMAEDGLYNLAGSSSQTRLLREFVEEMYHFCGGKGSFSYGKLPPNAEGPANLIPDITRMEKEIGWYPKTSFAEGITRMLENRKLAEKYG